MNKKSLLFIKAGFTLIELLIVIAVIAILTSIVFVALNPLGRFQDARNSTRWTDVNAVLSAIKLNQVDNKGIYITAIDDMVVDTYYEIGSSDNCNVTCANPDLTLQEGCVTLGELVDTGYLPAVPLDPSADGADGNNYYYIMKSSTGTLEVGACNEEAGTGQDTPVIAVKR
jgi:prepilin-type N-terminal cleavage/methylation domain-containing protein